MAGRRASLRLHTMVLRRAALIDQHCESSARVIAQHCSAWPIENESPGGGDPQNQRMRIQSCRGVRSSLICMPGAPRGTWRPATPADGVGAAMASNASWTRTVGEVVLTLLLPLLLAYYAINTSGKL